MFRQKNNNAFESAVITYKAMALPRSVFTKAMYLPHLTVHLTFGGIKTRSRGNHVSIG
jgi:hypothetical protein